MKAKELKEKLKNIPDDVEITITDMENYAETEFEVATYHDDTQTYLDLIIPIYIKEFTKEEL